MWKWQARVLSTCAWASRSWFAMDGLPGFPRGSCSFMSVAGRVFAASLSEGSGCSCARDKSLGEVSPRVAFNVWCKPNRESARTGSVGVNFFNVDFPVRSCDSASQLSGSLLGQIQVPSLYSFVFRGSETKVVCGGSASQVFMSDARCNRVN